ncbi:hypothetical protein B0H66DRAFT_57553 [Apodospora peruviana]|uniref:BHLH domain-containing protein n=1 Tax=Apodospora peruviana TaxID=516989 RepID=A0AAE0MG03_9PEZI|nr:hypothetical protein B0H66DRAFT_57553 [Apodospora peruviana]
MSNPTIPVDDKPRLTDEEKKANHIASEQKRRQAIREGFDRLAEIVPGLSGQGRSEAVVLRATVKYLVEQLRRRKALIELRESEGKVVDEKYKVGLEELDEYEKKLAEIPELSPLEEEAAAGDREMSRES